MVKRELTTETVTPGGWWEFNCLPKVVAGVDEVGRGALFGPVVAAAVILPASAWPVLMASGINDSKKLSPTSRSRLRDQICQLAIDWRIGFATTAEIDQLNILQATLLAMKRAVHKLHLVPELCLVDGNQPINDLTLPQQTMVKGDSLSLHIAAASIMAKVWRDDLITRLAVKYPVYDLAQNKGYGSKKHLMALQQYGPSPLHRRSFRGCGGG
jgi:ribonuclease HII